MEVRKIGLQQIDERTTKAIKQERPHKKGGDNGTKRFKIVQVGYNK